MRLRFALAALAVATSPATAAAEPCAAAIDQSQDGHGLNSLGTGPEIQLAQTFTVGTQGQLAEVWHSASVVGIAEGTAYFSITGTTPDGFPDTAQILGVRTVALPFPNEFWQVLDFRSSSIFVEAGTRLALVLRAEISFPFPDVPVDWTRRDGNPYVEGELLYRVLPGPWQTLPGDDTRFRTYLCPLTIPVEEASWGRLKAEYR